MKQRRLVIGCLALVAVLMVTSVTQAGFFDWLTGSEEDKTLKVIGAFSNEEQVFAEFTKQTGIEVKSLDMSSGEVLARAKAEGGKPMADLWFGGGVDSFIAAKQEGLLAQYKSPQAEHVPAIYKDNEGYWTGIYLVITGFIVNDQILAEQDLATPTSWSDLTKPQYQEEVLMSNPAISGTNYAIVNSLLQVKGSQAGWQYFKDLRKNIPYFSKRGSEPHKKVLLGEAGVGITYINGGIMNLPQEHPVSVIFPEDGIPWVPGCMAIFKQADNSQAAQKFVDWALSKKGQRFMRDINSTIMVREDIKQPEELADAPLDKLLKVDFRDFGTRRQQIIQTWNEQVAK
ncbi:MAG: ABC transporter substrate-binding protein [Bacillota bacterium]